MSTSDRDTVADLLRQVTDGPHREMDALVPLVYDELHRIAANYFRKERPGHTLQPTALVHEAYLRLIDQSRVDWRGRTHFLAVCAQSMRRVLVDHARGAGRQKRGGDVAPVSLQVVGEPVDVATADVIVIHDLIEQLAGLDPRAAKVVELRLFGGLNVDEVASVLDVSKRSIEGDWTHAKAWLRQQLADRGQT